MTVSAGIASAKALRLEPAWDVCNRAHGASRLLLRRARSERGRGPGCVNHYTNFGFLPESELSS